MDKYFLKFVLILEDSPKRKNLLQKEQNINLDSILTWNRL